MDNTDFTTTNADSSTAAPASDMEGGFFDESAGNEFADSPDDDLSASPVASETETLSEPGAEAEPAEAAGDEDIPKGYHNDPAWKRIITERNEARQKAEQFSGADRYLDALRQQAAEYGIPLNSWQDVPAADAAVREIKARQAQSQTALQTTLQTKEQELSQRVEMGDLTLEMAREVYQVFAEKESLRDTVYQAQSFMQQQQASQQMTQLSAQFPDADRDDVMAFYSAGMGALPDLMKQSHEKRTAYKNQILSEYNKKFSAGRSSAPVEGSGGRAPALNQEPDWDDPAFEQVHRQRVAEATRKRAGYPNYT